jgi:hypothetical protein
MTNFASQLRTILIGGLLISAVILVISLIGFIIDGIRKVEMSDQSGWRNFSRPILGFSFVALALLGIILVILILLGVF